MINKRLPVIYVLVAACLFGASAPLIKLLLEDIPPILLASFLYLGSGFGLLFYKVIQRVVRKEAHKAARLGKRDFYWLSCAIFSGGIAAPIILMYSLKYASAATASLLLNFESTATALIAVTIFHEAVSRRTWMAIVIITFACVILSFDTAEHWGFSLTALGIIGACILWGIDNNLTRNISAKDPVTIVSLKGIAAGSFSLLLALFMGNLTPGIFHILMSLLLGLFCYGLSIVFFIIAMREQGSSRTSAYFAIAPFFGAALSFIIFWQTPTVLFIVSLPFMIIGSFLLFNEKHLHLHIHHENEHEHVHNHDDGHHSHIHSIMEGDQKHSHRHKHEYIVHEHPHMLDIHHRHVHEGNSSD